MSNDEARLRMQLKLAGVGRRFLPAVLSDFGDRFKSLEVDKPKPIFIFGENGTGKTHLASALFRYWYRAAESRTSADRFVKGRYIMGRFKSTFDDRFESELDVERELSAPRLLVIDDISAIHATEYGVERLLAVIDSRYDNEAPTIVTSIWDAAKWKSKDPSLARRLASYQTAKMIDVYDEKGKSNG